MASEMESESSVPEKEPPDDRRRPSLERQVGGGASPSGQTMCSFPVPQLNVKYDIAVFLHK